MGSQQDVGLFHIRVHETAEHLLSQHGLVTVDEHANLKGFFRKGVGLFLVLCCGIIHQFEEIHQGNGFIHTSELI